MPTDRPKQLIIDSLASRINAHHTSVIEAASVALWHAKQAGELLIEAKATIPHGTWMSWLQGHFNASVRTAQDYMRVAEHWPQLEVKTQHAADLSIRGALAMLAPPEAESSYKQGDYSYRFMPPMTPEQYEPFKASIARHGQLVPAVIDEEGRIIDGFERERACRELGLDLQTRVVSGLTEEQKLQLSMSLNLVRVHDTERAVPCQ